MIIGLFALTVAAIFFGAAFYVNFAEQPARLHLDDRSLLVEWKPAYKRGFIMQASLAVIGFVLGMLAWWQTAIWLWLFGALVLVANNELMAIDPTSAGPHSRKLIQKWSRLHAVRTALGLAATLIFIAALLR
jgi:hypothetical protein